MSVVDILNKLAEKHIVSGNNEYAYRLVEAVDSSEKECGYCGKKSQTMKRKGKDLCEKCAKKTKCSLKGCEAMMMYGEMYKKGGKAYCCADCAKADKMKKTALDDLIEKYAGIEDLKKWQKEHGKKDSEEDKKESVTEDQLRKESSKGSYKNKIKSMEGFMKMDGDSFCFQGRSQASKALAVAEQAANFINWNIEKGDGCFKLVSKGFDKKSAALTDMIKKYAQYGGYHGDPGFENEIEDYKGEEGFRRMDQLEDQDLGDNPLNPYDPGSEKGMAWSEGYKTGYDTCEKGYSDFMNNTGY